MKRAFLLSIAGVIGAGSLAEAAPGASGATCSEQRLAYCKTQGMDDNGFGPGSIHNHCKRSPYGNRYEYLVATWQCMHQP